jgi:hypothetical protein
VYGGKDPVDPAALDARIKVELRQWLADVGPGLPAARCELASG